MRAALRRARDWRAAPDGGAWWLLGIVPLAALSTLARPTVGGAVVVALYVALGLAATRPPRRTS